MADDTVTNFFRLLFVSLARLSLFVIYVWFGTLKTLGVSPAGDLVHQLFEQTIPFVSFDTFYILFAWFEVLIGLLFLLPRFTRLAVILVFIHILTTFLPLVLLPAATWQSFLVPTLAGQYIIKNLLIVACAVGVWQSQKS